MTMEVSLRKAAQLSDGLTKAARNIKLGRIVKVSVHSISAIGDEVDAARLLLTTNVYKAMSLYDAAYAIRGLIGIANSESGINSLLTEKGSLDANEKLLNTVVSETNDYDEIDTSDELLEAKMIDLRQRRAAANATSGIHYNGIQDYLSVDVVDSGQRASLQDRLNELRRRKSAIADELLVKNMNTKITLPTEVVDLVKEFKLI
jgi:hypothetical protein